MTCTLIATGCRHYCRAKADLALFPGPRRYRLHESRYRARDLKSRVRGQEGNYERGRVQLQFVKRLKVYSASTSFVACLYSLFVP